MEPFEDRPPTQDPAMATRNPRPTLSQQVADAILRHRAGDPAALTDLVRAVTPWLRKVVRDVGLSAHSAEDAVQATLLSVVARGDQIRNPAAGLAWIAVTARREAIRVAQSERAVDLLAEIGVDDADTGTPGPEAVVLDRLRRALLWRHVAELSPRGQVILTEIAQVGRPDYAAISDRTGMPVGSIGPTRGRSLRQVRRLLEADEEWTGQWTRSA